MTDDPTTKCQPDAQHMSLYCALERATMEVSGKFEHRGAVMQEARFVIDDVEPDWEKKYHHLLVDITTIHTPRFKTFRTYCGQSNSVLPVALGQKLKLRRSTIDEELHLRKSLLSLAAPGSRALVGNPPGRVLAAIIHRARTSQVIVLNLRFTHHQP
jgi:hypothetical protein